MKKVEVRGLKRMNCGEWKGPGMENEQSHWSALKVQERLENITYRDIQC